MFDNVSAAAGTCADGDFLNAKGEIFKGRQMKIPFIVMLILAAFLIGISMIFLVLVPA